MISLAVLATLLPSTPAEPATNFTITRQELSHTERWYPAAEGNASAECRITSAGRLADCIVVQESAEGQGFGRSLINLTRVLRVEATAKDGLPAEGRRVLIQIVFR